MDKNNPAVREMLVRHDEFRTLFTEHEELERQLAEIDRHHYLSPEQQLERKRLQKLKLRGRDRMEELLHLAKETRSS